MIHLEKGINSFTKCQIWLGNRNHDSLGIGVGPITNLGSLILQLQLYYFWQPPTKYRGLDRGRSHDGHEKGNLDGGGAAKLAIYLTLLRRMRTAAAATSNSKTMLQFTSMMMVH